MVDAADLKSAVAKAAYEFKSRPRHLVFWRPTVRSRSAPPQNHCRRVWPPRWLPISSAGARSGHRALQHGATCLGLSNTPRCGAAMRKGRLSFRTAYAPTTRSEVSAHVLLLPEAAFMSVHVASSLPTMAPLVESAIKNAVRRFAELQRTNWLRPD